MDTRKTAKRAAAYGVGGLVVFLLVPLEARHIHGGAFAQSISRPSDGGTVIGTEVQGKQSITVTGSPSQTGPLVGGESNVTACPGQNGPRNVIGTYVGPGNSLSVTVTGNGGGGSVTGYRSSVTVGGPDCK